MENEEIRNAVIESVQLSTGDHGLTAWLTLDYGGSGECCQAFISVFDKEK